MKPLLPFALILTLFSCSSAATQDKEEESYKLSSRNNKKNPKRGIASIQDSGIGYTIKVFSHKTRENRTFLPNKNKMWSLPIKEISCKTIPEYKNGDYFAMDLICFSSTYSFGTKVLCNRNHRYNSMVLNIFNNRMEALYNLELKCKY